MNMSGFTILYAVLLIVLGLAGYFTAGMISVAALIPAFFGAAVLAAGLLALKDAYRKHALHAASLLALLGIIVTSVGSADLLKLSAGRDVERTGATVGKSVMAPFSFISRSASGPSSRRD